MKKFLLRLLGTVLLLSLILASWIFIDHTINPAGFEAPGDIARATISATRTPDFTRRQAQAREKLGISDTRQILFGDLHVHTTFSMDAFAWSMPIMNGIGMHPPADACDYARFCSRLDFWSTNDHSESLTPRHWDMIRDMVQQCNDVSGDPANPDMVTFLGWEWTQMGNTPDTHFGHRNVILKDQSRDRTPARPIMSGGVALKAMKNDPQPWMQKVTAPYLSLPLSHLNRQMMKSLYYKQDYLREQELCAEGIPSPELPADCLEYATTPGDLQRKLGEWGFPSMVIPHGTTWGYYTPPGIRWDKQLSREMHDPAQQTLIEVYSGHGNSEEHRDWRAQEYNADGSISCPAPSDNYLPCCHRAGQIIASRCADPDSDDCHEKTRTAEMNYLQAGRGGRLTIPDVEPQDWLNCGQCTDCFMPAFNYRPGNSVQYIMQLANHAEPDENGDPFRFKFGFIASSDNHLAQPGTGQKESGRHLTTDTSGAATAVIQKSFFDRAEPGSDPRKSVAFDLEKTQYNFLQVNETERQAAFFMTGGLVAAHSAGRDRDSIFAALQRKEVYATSGPRILLWFNLLQPDGHSLPMGSDLRTTQTPRFRVKALGSFLQQPGCPEESVLALGAERLDYMCGGECYNPGDARHPIEKIEIIRIRPRNPEDQEPGKLIEDPWRTYACDGGENGCVVEFDDPEYTQAGRDTLYYARALQAATPAINGKPIQCIEKDANGQCTDVKVCWGDERVALTDDCLDDVNERAWSSPIFLDYRASAAADSAAANVDTFTEATGSLPGLP